jgi:hypothetical protein
LNGLRAAALAAAVAAVAEILLPGRALYHAGWFNVVLGALVVVATVAGRRQLIRAQSARARLAILSLAAGAAIAGVAGVVSGLFAPDNQTFVGAPGQRISVEALGLLVFPLASTETSASPSVALQRPLHAPMEIGERPRDSGNFILRAVPRSVVYVEARDLRGNRLTITQPAGSLFLSPILLMQHRQTIAGMDLPYDSFTVPAAGRVVKVVMFTPTEAAMLLHGGAQIGEPAVLFAVDDENERPLPHGIALSAGGRAVRVSGLSLRAVAETYPAVEVVAAPNVLVTAFGALLVLGGLIASLSARY